MGSDLDKTPKRFFVLDSFRGLCALSVAIFHMNIAGSFTDLNFFRGSDVFVNFFFVLSGFVMTHRYAEDKSRRFSSYFVSRFFRLVPVHLVMLMVFIGFEWAKYLAATQGMAFNNVAFEGRNAVSEILPNLFLIHAWSSYTEPLSFNHPSWSISIEFYLYLLFYLTLNLMRDLRVIVWLGLSVAMFLLIYSESEMPVQYVQWGLGCYFAGCLTHVFYQKFKSFRPGLVLGTALELICIVLLVYLTGHYVEHRALILSALFCVLLYVYAQESGVISQLLKFKFFVFLGQLSYSIYMVHAAVIFATISAFLLIQHTTQHAVAPMVNELRTLTLQDPLLNHLLAAGMVLLMLGAALVLHHLIERPGQRLGRRVARRLTHRE